MIVESPEVFDFIVVILCDPLSSSQLCQIGPYVSSTDAQMQLLFVRELLSAKLHTNVSCNKR